LRAIVAISTGFLASMAIYGEIPGSAS